MVCCTCGEGSYVKYEDPSPYTGENVHNAIHCESCWKAKWGYLLAGTRRWQQWQQWLQYQPQTLTDAQQWRKWNLIQRPLYRPQHVRPPMTEHDKMRLDVMANHKREMRLANRLLVEAEVCLAKPPDSEAEVCLAKPPHVEAKVAREQTNAALLSEALENAIVMEEELIKVIKDADAILQLLK